MSAQRDVTTDDPLFAPLEPFATHRLAVSDGHVLWVEECGRPDGVPVLFLHGGPGSGCSPTHRRLFDPARYRAILVDQRGCGRSTPLGSLRANTTADLLADLERVRDALAIERWFVFGGSWGSLLGLSYAQAHPAAVAGLVLRGIFFGSPEEIGAYLAGADGSVPAAWQALRRAFAGAPDLLEACRSAVLEGTAEQSSQAARAWLDYERALMGEGPLPAPPDAAAMAKVRIQMHYLPAACFVDDRQLLAGVDRIRTLPAALVQGLADAVCPPRTAERLKAAWPEARWIGLPGEGHSGMAPAVARACIAALDDMVPAGA